MIPQPKSWAVLLLALIALVAIIAGGITYRLKCDEVIDLEARTSAQMHSIEDLVYTLDEIGATYECGEPMDSILSEAEYVKSREMMHWNIN